MKVYIATNKDNKDSLMHYGVKGMRWGKRGGRRAGDLEKDSTRTPYADTQSVSRVKTTNSKNNLLPIGRAHAAKKIMRKNVSAGGRDNGDKISNGDRDAKYAWQRRAYEKRMASKDRDGYRLSGKGEVKADDRWFRHLVDNQKRDYKQDESAKRYHRLAKDLEWQQKNQNYQDRKNTWNMDLGVFPTQHASANMDKKMQKVGDLLKRKKANKRR